MPVAFVTVKLPDGSVVHLDVDLKTRVEDFRTILAPKSGVKRHKQRLVFAGRLLQDGRTLEAYGIERNSTIHLLAGSTAAEGPSGVDISTIPPQLGALQRHVLQNPDILQQMLESPAMQSLLNDHDFMRSLLKMDPRLGKLLELSPDLNQMLYDTEFTAQATEALRNPVHVRDVLRSTDRAMTQLEALGGSSFDVLRQMCEDIRKPLEDSDGAAETARSPAKKKKEGDDGDEEEELTAPSWLGDFDTNAMASMMQDSNMQHLLAQLTQTLVPQGVKVHPDDPLIDAGFIGQMYHAQTIQSMALLQQSVEKLSMTGGDDKEKKPEKDKEKDKGKKGDKGKAEKEEQPPAQDSPAVLSGLHPNSPAANFEKSFKEFIQAEQESPEVRFKGQLQAMKNMGFTDTEKCIQALHNENGNMNKAVAKLMEQGSK